MRLVGAALRFLVEPMAAQIAGRAGDEMMFTSPAGEVPCNNNFHRRVFDRAADSARTEGTGSDLDVVRPGRRNPV